MSKGTTHRTVRIEDDLWQSAKDLADERGDNLSEVIRQALRQYVDNNQGVLTMSKDPSYDSECYRCDYDMHVCGGCGEPLRHDGNQHDGSKHPSCT